MKANTPYAEQVMNAQREPCFDNFLKVLRRERPPRPTLFEFFMNRNLYEQLAGYPTPPATDQAAYARFFFEAFRRAGYDYATLPWTLAGFSFPRAEQEHAQTISINAGAVITDRASFDKYPWPDPDKLDYSFLDRCAEVCPAGMKTMAYLPGGLLENAVALVGYENLCYLLSDDPSLAGDVFDAIGSRLLTFVQRYLAYDVVGIGMVNDDWGFKTQTMLATADMRRYIFPWHRKIAAAIHAAGRPALLHSCGNLRAVMTDITDDIRFDGKHSYEDTICPIEDAYDSLRGRIAVLGGIDVDFMCRAQPADIHHRARAMLERSSTHGGYALGTGNSVPEYIPAEAYFALIAAAICR